MRILSCDNICAGGEVQQSLFTPSSSFITGVSKNFNNCKITSWLHNHSVLSNIFCFSTQYCHNNLLSFWYILVPLNRKKYGWVHCVLGYLLVLFGPDSPRPSKLYRLRVSYNKRDHFQCVLFFYAIWISDCNVGLWERDVPVRPAGGRAHHRGQRVGTRESVRQPTEGRMIEHIIVLSSDQKGRD